MERMPRVLHMCISVVSLWFGCTQDVPCHVTTSDGQTRYDIPGFTATDCQYSFSNGTDNVLANQNGKVDGLVLFNNETTMILRQCSELVFYQRNCLSEGMLLSANCSTNCSGGTERWEIEGTPLGSWMTPVILGTVLTLVLVLVLILCFVFKKYNNKEDSCI